MVFIVVGFLLLFVGKAIGGIICVFTCGISVLSCRPINNSAGLCPHQGNSVALYAKRAMYGSVYFFNKALTVFTVLSARALSYG